MIKVEDVTFRYDGSEKNALDGVSAEIGNGEFVAVLGHNGSGKSTLAKHFNALLQPSEGTVWVNGLDTRDEANIWEIRKNVGMVFQNPDHQIVATIVCEDVAFGPENLGVPSAEIAVRVEEALRTVGMAEHMNSAPHRLSGGQKQRVAIAGVLAMRTNCMVLDESTSMLDPSGRKEVLDTVIRLNKETGITVVLITHYMDEAILADRVLVMDEGKIVRQGTPKEVFRDVEGLKAIGLDVPQAAEVGWLLRKMGLEMDDDLLTVEEMVDTLVKMR
jgi:energy-coupling factor transport system ATP-binding protein